MAVKNAGIHVPAGFLFASATAGLKQSGEPDLAFAEAPCGASAAAVFTKNQVVAAPVTVGRKHLKLALGRVRALVVNSGNANCATGSAGMKAAVSVCDAIARTLSVASEFVFPSSTGIIGVPLPVEKILAATTKLEAAKSSSSQAVQGFARAIMTTDTRPKVASVRVKCGSRDFSVLGIAKGSGMIHPNLATMLVYLFTDAEAAPTQLKKILKHAVDRSFNRISVDGDTSTNDTVLLLASGKSQCKVSDKRVAGKLQEAIADVCWSLAQRIVEDGEGVKHVVELRVDGARTDSEADQVARTIAHSQLVKTAWAGADPNWGRILAATGRAGIELAIEQITIQVGQHEVFRRGQGVPFDAIAVHKVMQQPRYQIRVSLGKGRGTAQFVTGDLTAEYVHINADYST